MTSGRTNSRTTRALIPVTLLVIVAAAQMWAVARWHLSPWKGGGFGMFSTVASPGARFLRITVTIGTDSFRVAAPASTARLVREVRTLPTTAAARRLAETLLGRGWIWYARESVEARHAALLAAVEPDRPRTAPADVAPAESTLVAGAPDARHALSARCVAVEVWEYQLEVDAQRLVARRLAEALARSDRSDACG